jgi:N-acetylglutamate synthase
LYQPKEITKFVKKSFMFEFLEMNLSHYEAANELWKQTEGMGVTTDSLEQIEKYLKRNPGMSFVCIDNATGKLAGTVMGGHDGRRGIIYHLASAKENRNKGIAKKLIELSTKAMKKKGIERCLIMVLAENKSGHDFWRKIGWQRREDLCMYSVNLRKSQD